MTHLWVRAETRPNEARVGITPDGVALLRDRGFRVTVEESPQRALPIHGYRDAGAEIAPAGAWREAPLDAIVFGLKDLPNDGTPLAHRHIMFGHAYKGQAEGARLLERFAAGGGTLYDLEYLVDGDGRRLAAFGYWAGFAGAAMSLIAWAAQQTGRPCPPARTFADARALADEVKARISPLGTFPTVLVIGARGRTGGGAADLCVAANAPVTRWDLRETAHGGPFPQIMAHHLLLNCILAGPDTPTFVPADAARQPRRLTVIGDIACDPGTDISPIKVYDRATSWDAPILRVHESPPLDVMAIDNLPSMLPIEASVDFAAQLLPTLFTLDRIDEDVWGRAEATFRAHRP